MKRIFACLFLLVISVYTGLQLTGCTKKTEENLNIFHTYQIAKPKGLDPALGQDLYSTSEIVRVYETLLQYQPFKRPYELEPLLAEAMPDISKDGLIYTFKIRKGVLFHDDASFPGGKGRELKAKDFVYSLKRLADPKVKSTGWWILEGRVKGLDEWRAKIGGAHDTTAMEEEVAGLKVLDDYTLRIELKQPYPQMMYAMAMPYTSAVAKEATEKYGEEFMNHAVGTGPFILEAYDPANKITYKRNPNYWAAVFPAEGSKNGKTFSLEDAGKKLPFVDGVEVSIFTEDQPRYLNFMAGNIDASTIPKDNLSSSVEAEDSSRPLGIDNMKLKPEVAAKGVELIREASLDFTYTAFNLESKDVPQFKDKRVRQAISMATSNKEMIHVFYNDIAIPAQSPIPPNVNGYDPELKNAYKSEDLEKAKKLLAAAGFPEGKGFPEVTYDTTNSSTDRQMAEMVVKDLARLGIKVKVNPGTWPQLLKRVQERQAQLWGVAWGADYPDAENFLQLFYGPNAQPGGMNGSYYKNPEFDKIFEKARVMQDSPARTELYKKLAKILAEDNPVVFNIHRYIIGMKHGFLKNYVYDEFPFNRAKYVKIDLEAKKKFGK